MKRDSKRQRERERETGQYRFEERESEKNACVLERKEQKNTGRIFKHDVAITSDQRGIFHPPPLRSTKSRGRDEPTPPHPCYGLLTGNLPRLLLTVLSLHSLAFRPSDAKLSLSLSLSTLFSLLCPSPLLPHFHSTNTASSSTLSFKSSSRAPFSFSSAESFKVR